MLSILFTATAVIHFLAACVIATYAVIVWRLLRTAAAAEDRFGMLVAIGVAAMLTFHVFVNVGMTLGIMPVTGIPLPFLSAGGSSFTAMAFALGITHSIWLHRSKVPTLPPYGMAGSRQPAAGSWQLRKCSGVAPVPCCGAARSNG